MIANSGNQNREQQLLTMLNQASFAVDDAVLFLDTHPDDRQALEYYQYYRKLRQQALDAYEDEFGPMSRNRVNNTNYWQWIQGKWPWEGGGC